jgi:hypothetical protein
MITPTMKRILMARPFLSSARVAGLERIGAAVDAASRSGIGRIC